MKYSIFILLAFILSLTSHSQNIPNGDLEEWQTVGGWFDNPSLWTTLNSQVLVHAIQDSMACEENLALKVSPLPGIETTMGVAETSFPISFIPSNFGFCAKSNIVSEDSFTDTCRVELSFWNQGILVYRETWTNTESLSEWTGIVLPLNQIEPIITDCKITVQASFPGIGLGSGSIDTWISVDDFQFSLPDHVPENSPNVELTVFPNPSPSGVFQLSSDQKLEQILVYDLLGNLVYVAYTSDKTFRLNLTFCSGIYFVQVGEIRKKVIVSQN